MGFSQDRTKLYKESHKQLSQRINYNKVSKSDFVMKI